MDAPSSHTLPWPTLIALLILPLVLLHLLLIIVFHTTSGSRRATKLPPGPIPLPIIGNLLHVGPQPHRSLQQLSRKYGDIMYLRLGRVPTVVISSADMAEKVLKTHDVDLCSRPRTVVFKKLTYNFLDVALSPYGDNWRRMRKICTMELFSSKKVQSTRVIREEVVVRVMKEIAQAASSTNHCMAGKVNLTDMLLGITQGIMSRLALGRNWSVESGSGNKLVEPIKLADILMGGIFMADYFPWAGWVDAIRGLKQKLDVCFIGISDYFDEVIDEHLRPKTDQRVLDYGEDFLDIMLRMEKHSSLTRDHIKAVLMNIFLAGIDTMSCTMIWAMSELLRNSRVMEKAQEEIRKIAGRKGKVEDSDLMGMQYLKAVVKEVLRLHPPGPLLVPREAIRGSTVDGYEIPHRARVLVNVFAIGSDPRYWKNPLEFSPERFLDESSSINFKGTHYEFLPFGAGRRICPGMELGMAIVELTLANLLYCFDWELPPGMKEEDIDMSEGDGITVCKKIPLIVVPCPFHHQ